MGAPLIALWLVSGTAVAILAMVAAQPFRLGFESQLLETPRFALETALGAVAIGLLGAAGLKSALPGSDNGKLARWAWVLTMLWLSNYVLGLFVPTLEPSMTGKRPHCVWETLLYSLPTLAVGLWLVSRGYVLNWRHTAALLAAAAGAIPALLMQLACMYGAKHILLTHIAPALLLVSASLILGLVLQHRSNRRDDSGM